MAQSPQDSRLASLGLLLGAGMLGYSYYQSRQGVGPLAGGGAVATGKTLADLDAWTRAAGLRLVQSPAGNPNDYTLVPQPGMSFAGPDAIVRAASGAGFAAGVAGGQAHVVVPGAAP